MPTDLAEAILTMASPTFAAFVPVEGRAADACFFQPGVDRTSMTPSVEPSVAAEELPPMPAALARVLLRYPRDVEFRGPNEWVFFSMDDVARQGEDLQAHGQPRVVPLALRYRGMGSIDLLACDRADPERVFTVVAGGANGHERLHNHQALLKQDVTLLHSTTFDAWMQLDTR